MSVRSAASRCLGASFLAALVAVGLTVTGALTDNSALTNIGLMFVFLSVGLTFGSSTVERAARREKGLL